MENILSAEEWLQSSYGRDILSIHDTRKSIAEEMISFAKMHLENAIQEIMKNIQHDIEINYINPYDYSAGHDGLKGDIDKDSILNAYPLENIK